MNCYRVGVGYGGVNVDTIHQELGSQTGHVFKCLLYAIRVLAVRRAQIDKIVSAKRVHRLNHDFAA